MELTARWMGKRWEESLLLAMTGAACWLCASRLTLLNWRTGLSSAMDLSYVQVPLQLLVLSVSRQADSLDSPSRPD